MTTTFRLVLWFIPFIYLFFKLDEWYPWLGWRLMLFTLGLTFVVWRVIVDGMAENARQAQENARIRRLEDFYEQHHKDT